MAHADWIIDLGPGAGHDGGRIVFEGTPAELVAARPTLTGEHLAAYVGRPEPLWTPRDEAHLFRLVPPRTDQRCCRCHEYRNLQPKRRLRVVDAGHEAPDRAPKHEHHTGDTSIFRMSLPKYGILRSITLITKVRLNSRITYRLPLCTTPLP